MYLFVLLTFIVGSNAVICPYYCSCDIWEYLRRATCKNQKLININVDFPEDVQVLDLSSNYIMQLRNDDLLQITSLKYLNISHNKITTIEMHAFRGLNELNILDVSNNHLQYIHKETFEDIPELQLLILSGNRIGTFEVPPALNIPSLQVLQLRNCQFNFMAEDTFSHLPNITTLDLSDNQFAQLKIGALRPLVKLASLNISGNPWLCNTQTMEAIAFLVDKDVQFTSICQSEVKKNAKKTEVVTKGNSFSPQKFGKMISVVSSEEDLSDGDSDDDNENDSVSKEVKIKGIDQDISEIWYVDKRVPCIMPSPDEPFTEAPKEKMHVLESFMLQIPSYLAFLVGMQLGAIVALFGMWLWLGCSFSKTPAAPQLHESTSVHPQSVQRTPSQRRSQSQRRSRRMRSDGSQYTELETVDCPGTPPPPYRDIFIA